MRAIRLAVFCLLVTLAAAPGLWAQTQITSGVIQGVVQDETGAVMPGATVTVRNLDTNLEQTAETNERGRFVFLQLRSGPYTLRASKQGFTTIIHERMPLTVGQTIPLTLTLRVSPVAEEIIVTGSPTVDIVRTESSSTLNQMSIENTPVLGRKFEDLFSLTPGVVIVSSPDGDQVTFAGQRGTANNISLDGGDYNNGFFGEQSGGQRPATDITMDAIKEFQVIATGGTAEFGRTAGGIVNVITKSGTNELHGSLFHFQRAEALTANDSQGRPLDNFEREQFGGTIGGPIVQDKAFFFGAIEQIFEELTRPNLSEQLGATACPQQTFTVGNSADETLIGTNSDCQRLALLEFFQTNRGQAEGNPVTRDIENTSFLGKFDLNITPATQLSVSYTMNRSENISQTFDVPTFGNSANGIEGTPSIIQALNVNLFSTVSSTMFNEAHFTYGREKRPRAAVQSNVPADTGIGFAPSFRFGNPFFLQPNIDEVFWRTQIRDNFSIIAGSHTIKFGGEWIHSVNDQVFRGFATGRYIFGSVNGFLRYTAAPLLDLADPAFVAGFGPTVRDCADFTFGDFRDPTTCPAGFSPFTGPLLLYLQSGSTGLTNLALGESNIDNEDFGFFVQDKWQVLPNFTLNLGVRWDVQQMADIVADPSITSYGSFLSNPSFPSDGTIPDQNDMVQPRVGFAWDPLNNGKSVLRASWGLYYARHNMLAQVGSITDNGVQQQIDVAFSSEFFSSSLGPMPVWPNVIPVPAAAGASPFASVKITARDFENPRTQTANVSWEQEFAPDWAYYVDFTWAKSVHLTRFLNINANGADLTDPCANSFGVIDPSQPTGAPICGDGNPPPTDGNAVIFPIPFGGPFAPLGDVFLATSPGKSLYRGVTIGMRKKFSQGFQLEWNYRYARDRDDDSNERDPFTDRSFNRLDLSRDYSLSDRDIKHIINFFTYVELPGSFELNARIQGRTAQPITQDPVTGDPRVLNGVDRGRNSFRKDTKFFSLDWRLSRPFRWGERYAITPIFEMFNSFDNDNNLNPLTTNLLFNFDGFLRQGVGDPLQVQLAVKFTF